MDPSGRCWQDAAMPIPSPDAALVGLADALIARPQRRGVPLPLILAPISRMPAYGALGVAASMPGIGMAAFGPIWVLMAMFFWTRSRPYARRLMADARNWTPDRAKSYRAEAMRERAERGPARATLLAVTAIPATSLAVNLSGAVPFGPWGWSALAYLAFALCVAAQLYARTAFPRDPDLAARVPQAAMAAGA
jgi:hypothetical protein